MTIALRNGGPTRRRRVPACCALAAPYWRVVAARFLACRAFRALFFRVVAALFLTAAALGARAEIVLTDDLGRKIFLQQPARRLVTLAPSITEAAFAVCAGHRVVGMSAWSDHPPAAASLPVVSTAFAIDMEALARLAPDLVIAWKDSFRPADIGRLEALGAQVFVVQSRTLGEIPRLLTSVATLAGGDAAPAVRAYESRRAQLRVLHAGKTRPRLFREISHRPLMTIEIDGAGTGLMMLSRKVLETLKEQHEGPSHWFHHERLDEEYELTDDLSFCNRVRLAGFSLWGDCDLEGVVHWKSIKLSN